MKLYLYPFTEKNEFIDRNKVALTELSFTVKKIDSAFFKNLIKMKRDSIVVFNWLEDRVYSRSLNSFLLPLLRLVFLVVFSKLFAKQVVWVRHNYLPHHGTSTNRRYKFFCGLFRFLNIKDIGLEGYYSKPSLIHPLYKTDEQLSNDINNSASEDQVPSNVVVFFGAVKKYKNLHSVLESWSADIPLIIAGYCDDPSYQHVIEEKIKSKGLRVEWINKFLSNDELNHLLKNTKFVLLPHADLTMISSGSFYHAIGEGCNIITNNSQFGRYKSGMHDFVTIYDPEKMSIDYLNEIYQNQRLVLQDALAFYGEQQVKAAWLNILAIKKK